jgi:hypothetical protein
MPAKRAYGMDQDFYPWSPIVARPVLRWPDNARVANAARIPSPITGAATRAASAMAQNRSTSSRVPPSASTCRTQTCGTCRSAGTARIACFVSSHIRTVNFMPVISGGGSAEERSTGVAVGSAPLAARSAIRPLTWSDDIDAGNCNTTVAPAGSAAHPTGVTQSRSSSAKARDRAAIIEYLSGFASITRLPGRTRGRSGIGHMWP